MGYIKSITIENFKSFKGTTTIEPFNRWTSVVGPNGSGKSNFFEAIAFVLDSSAYRLKKANYSDLIYKSEDNRSNIQMASVTLCYLVEDEDETDGIEAGEMKFKRIVAKTGFSYQINGTQYSKSEYNQTLRKLKITPSTCLIFQTQVNQISTRSDIELANEFEEISGSIELRQPIIEKRNEINVIDEEMKKVFKENQSINTKIKDLNKQNNEFQQCNKVKEELSKLKVELNLRKLHYYHSRIIKNEKNLDEIDKAIKNYNDKEIKDIGKKLKENKQDIAKISGELSIKRNELELCNEENYEERRITLIANKDSTEKTKQKLQLNKEMNENHVKSLKDNIEKIGKVINRNEKLKDENTQQMNNLIAKTINKTSNDSFMELNRQYNNEVSDYMKRQNILNESKKGILSSIRLLNDNLNSIKDEVNEKREKIEEDNEEKERLEREQKDKNEENAKIDNEINSLKKELDKCKASKEDIERRNKTLKDQIFTLKSQINNKSNDKKLEEVKQQLIKNFNNKIIGEFTSLVQINNDQYYEAITRAYGRYKDAIVIKQQKDAKEMIEFIVKNKYPPITFLPLDAIQSTKVKDSDRNEVHPHGFDFAVDLVSISKEYEDIRDYVLGTTVICEEMQNVIDLINQNRSILRYRFVSKDGMIMNKSRCITGGGNSGENSGNNKKGKSLETLEKESEKLNKQLNEIIEKCSMNRDDSIISKIKRLEGKMRENNNELLNRINSGINVLGNRINGNNSKLIDLKKEEKKNNEKISKYESDIRGIDKELSSIKKDMEKIHENIFGSMSNSNEDSQAISVLQERVNGLENERNNINNTLEKLTQSYRAAENDINTANDEIKKLEKSIEEKKKIIDSITDELNKIKENKNCENKKETIKNKIKELEKNLETLEKEREDKKKEKEEKNKQYINNLELLNKYKNTIDQLRSTIHDVLDKCRFEIELPLKDIIEEEEEEEEQESENNNLMSESQDTFSQSTHSTEERIKLDNKLVKNIDFSIIKDYNDDDNDDNVFNQKIKEVEERIEKLKASLVSTATNGNAADDIELYKKEQEKIKEKFKELNKNKESLVKQLENLKNERDTKFNELFDIVEANINEIYKELSKSSDETEGGSAYINNTTIYNIENNNNNNNIEKRIAYHVTPENKRNGEMNKLSGGEKTIASLALLFAIHKYQKTPFIVMDEIDAELDNNNVMNVQRYLLNHKEDIQFITVSLKDLLFSESDALVGVYKKENRSNLLSLDMSNYH